MEETTMISTLQHKPKVRQEQGVFVWVENYLSRKILKQTEMSSFKQVYICSYVDTFANNPMTLKTMYCSDLLWEEIFLEIEKKLLKFEAEGKILEINKQRQSRNDLITFYEIVLSSKIQTNSIRPKYCQQKTRNR